MGHCHYCYLQTTMGSKPYIRTYVNVDEIFDAAQKYMDERALEITRLEASCTSDIVGVDHLTHHLELAIEFFVKSLYGMLLFVYKFAYFVQLLNANYQVNTILHNH